jgi:hypothetical protein
VPPEGGADSRDANVPYDVITADVAFRLAANAAAAQYAAAPPYLQYHTRANVDVPALNRHKVIEREVETRTKDDHAVLQDLPNGQRQYGQSFPLIPTFDALSYFRLEYNGAQRDALSHVTLYAPITFTDSHPANANVAVVATTLRYYYAQYAADTTDAVSHIVMQPLQTLTKGNNSDFYLHDVYVDTTTMLPTRVTYTGHDDTELTFDYMMVQNHWLVDHAFYARTLHGPLHIGSVHFTVDATFDQFAFPETPNDPQLK